MMAHDCDRFADELMKCIDAFEAISAPNPKVGQEILISSVRAIVSKNDETYAEQHSSLPCTGENLTSTPKKSVRFNSTVGHSPKSSLDFNVILNHVLKNSSIKICGILKKTQTSSSSSEIDVELEKTETKSRTGRKRKPISFYSEDEEVFSCDSDWEEDVNVVSRDKIPSQQIQNKKKKSRKLLNVVPKNIKRPPTKTKKKNEYQLSQEFETTRCSNNDHNQNMSSSNEDNSINNLSNNSPKTSGIATSSNPNDYSTTTTKMMNNQEKNSTNTSTNKMDESTKMTIKIPENFVIQHDTAENVGNISVNEIMNPENLSFCWNWSDNNRKFYKNKKKSNTVKQLVIIPPGIPSTAHIDCPSSCCAYPMHSRKCIN